MTKMITPLISNFLLYKTGFFHCIRKKSSGSSFSSDPASGGIPTLRPDGTLVYELTDLRQKRGDPKVLFFATDRLFHAEGLTEDQKIALDFFTQYLRRFQAYGYDSEGNLTELSSVFETPFQTIDLRDAALQAEIYEKLSHKKHIGPEETTEYISADEVLIIDDEFITRMIAMLLEADSHHPINHKIFRISMLSFMGDSDYLPPAFIQRLSEIRCASFEVVKGSRLEKVFGFLEHLPALEFLELKTDQACDADIFHHLPPKVLAQLIELRLTDTCPPSRPVKYSRISQFPSQAEAVSLSGFDVSDISLTTTRLREFRVGGPQSSELLKAMIPLSPFLTHIESTNREKVEMASSVRSSINVSGRAFSDLKFCRYAEEMPGTSSVDKFIRNPLDFNPQDDRPLQSQIVFVARAGREIPPHHYLKHFYQLENLENLETLGLKKIEFKASFPMVITNQNTRITRKNQYQGRLETFLNAGVIYNLPHLPHARMLAMKLPPHCALYQDERTGQYGIKSTIAQSALLEWLIQAEEPQQPKPLSAKSSRIFDDLSFIIREGKIQLNRPITWQRFSSEIQKIQSVAAWISGFSSKNAKTSASDFANPIDHLNAIIQGKKGRCSERAFLFEVMIRMLFPKIRSYYIENELHAFSLIQFDNRKALCFDLGGVEATLKIALRVLVEPTAAPLPTPTRTPTRPLSTSVSPPKAALKKVSFESEGPADLEESLASRWHSHFQSLHHSKIREHLSLTSLTSLTSLKGSVKLFLKNFIRPKKLTLSGPKTPAPLMHRS
jgi:hypothetical protein